MERVIDKACVPGSVLDINFLDEIGNLGSVEVWDPIRRVFAVVRSVENLNGETSYVISPKEGESYPIAIEDVLINWVNAKLMRRFASQAG